MLLFIFVICSCSTESIEQANIVEAGNVIEVEQQLLDLVNDHRGTLGFDKLNFSQIAYDQANRHTDYMIAKGTINHDNFKVRASNISSTVNAVYVSENVAKDYDSALEAFQNWLSSTDHRETIEGNFTHSAVSIKRNPDGELYFTHLFYR